MHLLNTSLRERSQKQYILYDSIAIKCKYKLKQSMLVEATTLPPRREKKETVFWRTSNSLSLDVNDALV